MSSEFTEENKRGKGPLSLRFPPSLPAPHPSTHRKGREEAFKVMARRARATREPIRQSSFHVGILYLVYTFLSPLPYSQLSTSFMINRYARKLLILSLGIMLITKSNLCKKASCWRRMGRGSSGARKEGLGGGRTGLWAPAGRGSWWGLKASGGRVQVCAADAHFPALRQASCCQAGVCPSAISRSTELLTKPKPKVLYPVPLVFP